LAFVAVHILGDKRLSIIVFALRTNPLNENVGD